MLTKTSRIFDALEDHQVLLCAIAGIILYYSYAIHACIYAQYIYYVGMYICKY